MRRKTCRNGFFFVAAICLGLMVTSARGGSLDAPAAPTSPASAMYTLQDIYNYLTTGVRASKRSGGFTEPTAGPTVGTMHTLNEIMEAGIIPPKTGQTNSYAVGDDGTNRIGLAWPNPRFTVVGTSGTAATNQIRDNLTGLIWARKANFAGGTKSWSNAFDYIAATNASLTGYGGTNDWRLPNWQELRSLIDARWSWPALCNTEGTAKLTAGNPFTDVQADLYWSSTTHADGTVAWDVNLDDGAVAHANKTTTYYVWPVRGGR